MSNIEITFEYPWLLLLFLPVTALIILPFFLVPKKRRYTVKRILPLVLHVLIAAALVLVLSGFSVTKQISEQAVILLLDLSDSTETVQASMEAHAKELLRTIDRTVPVGVVAFGEQQVCLIEPQGKDRTLVLKDPGAKATDLEAALHFAASLAPENKALRIILMTDGKETDGTAENAAYELANRGIRLDALYFDTTGLPTEEVQLGSFTAPVGVYKDKDAILSSEIKSNVDCVATVTLYENDLPILEKEYEIVSGSNMIEMTVTPKSAGMYTYRMVVQAPKDTVLKNNEAFACLPVAGRSTVLVIADTNHNAEVLANILKEENDVTAVTAYRAPKSLAELCKYDAVVLSNVHCADLPRYYEETLQEYVGGYGRTLLAVGGRETFMFGDMQETALSDMLPVTLSLEESGEGNSVALMLVLDCSSSMKGDRFMIAKQGAIKCLDAMSDNDYVGVVSFSKTPNLDTPPLRANNLNKEELTRTISALELGRGTYYTEALKLAKEELEKSDAKVKHILFLSDGQPSDDGYYTVAAEASEQGITVSTIGLSYSSYILSSIADCGSGRYYYVESADDLPDIMLSETEQARVSSLIVGDFVPVIKEESPLTESLGGAPLSPLGGYLGTTLKEEATAYLTTDKGHPIYAAWDFGYGRVACFTSDLNGGWSDRWLGDPTCRALTLGMISTTVPEVHAGSALRTEVKLYGKSAKISVETATASEANTVTVNVTENGQSASYELTRVHPGRYEGSLPLHEEGVYGLHIVEKNPVGNTVDELQTGVGVSYSAEYDCFEKGSPQRLHALCDITKGALFEEVSALASVKPQGVRSVYNPIIPIAVLLCLWLLADIAVRKIRLKDLKGYYLKTKELFGKK